MVGEDIADAGEAEGHFGGIGGCSGRGGGAATATTMPDEKEKGDLRGEGVGEAERGVEWQSE